MSNQYGKIFQQIYDGSLRSDPMVRLVFMDMVILADKDGMVDMTHEAIAARTNVPIKSVCDAIKSLESPDPRSRSSRENGARIKRLDEHRDWGWCLINYEYYVKKSSAADRMEQNRINKQRQRERDKSADVSNGQRLSAKSAHIDIDIDIDKKEKIYKKEKVEKATQFPPDFKLTPELKTYAIQKGIPEHNVRDCFEHFENHHRAKGSTMKDWNRAWYTWVQKAKAFDPTPKKDSAGSSSPTADRKFNEFMRVMKL